MFATVFITTTNIPGWKDIYSVLSKPIMQKLRILKYILF